MGTQLAPYSIILQEVAFMLRESSKNNVASIGYGNIEEMACECRISGGAGDLPSVFILGAKAKKSFGSLGDP